jgi:GntR family transcriptional regulator/MocR family aminotransferase
MERSEQMKYKIDKTEHSPAYLQLYRQIRDDITRQIFRFGDKMPSKRMIAEDTGVSVITAEHAYELLLDEGYLESRERSGYYVVYREADVFPVADENRRERRKPGNSDRRWMNTEEREDFPFPGYARIMRRVITEYGERIMVKSPNQGLPELRRAIADYLARSRGILVGPEQIVIGSGAEYLYSLIVQILGRNVVYGLESPSYAKIAKVYQANGATCEFLPLGEEGILSEALSRTSASVLHVTPFNSYPTGITASASKRHEYVHWAETRNTVIVEDDFDSEFSGLTKAEDTLFSLEPEKTVIYMNTFSKSIAPSIRAGYMVLPEKRVSEFLEKISFYSCTVPVFDQYVLAECISGGEFERHINRVRRKRRQMNNTSIRTDK